MKKRYWMRFFEEPDDNKGGGGETSRGTAVFEPPAKATTGTPEPKTGDGEPASGAAVSDKEEPPAPPAPFDASKFAKEFGGVIAAEMGKAKTKEEPALTPEEAKKLLNVFEFTPEWIAKFNNLETQKSAMDELRDGVVKHSDTITQHRLKELQTAIEEKFSPMMERIQSMDNEQREKRFETSFPQLGKPALKPLLQAVAQSLVDQGKKFDDETSMFAAIASGAEAVIKETNPDFKLTAGSTPAPTKKTNNAIPVTTPGSGGGTAAKGPAPTKARGLAIFDK